MARHCKECLICQRVGKPNQKIKPVPLVKVPHLPKPFTTIQVDVVGSLKKTKRGNEYLLTMVDAASRYVNAVPLRRITVEAVCRNLRMFFSFFGVPCKVQTDGASYFCGRIFDTFCNSLGIKHSVSSPYHPQTLWWSVATKL